MYKKQTKRQKYQNIFNPFFLCKLSLPRLLAISTNCSEYLVHVDFMCIRYRVTNECEDCDKKLSASNLFVNHKKITNSFKIPITY